MPATADTVSVSNAVPLTEDTALVKLLNVGDGEKAKRPKGIEAVTLDGFPYLRNEQVIYL